MCCGMKPRPIIYLVIFFLLAFVLVFGEKITFTSISEENWGAPHTKQVEGSITLNSSEGIDVDFYQIEEKYLISEVLGKNSQVSVWFNSSEWDINSFICTTKDPSLTLTAQNLFSNYIDIHQSVGLLTIQGEMNYIVETKNTYYIVFRLDGFALQARIPYDERPLWYNYTTTVAFFVDYVIQDTYELQIIRAPLQSSLTPLLLGGIVIIAIVDLGNFESIKNEVSIRVNQIQSTRMVRETENTQRTQISMNTISQRRSSEDHEISNQELCSRCYKKVRHSEIFCSHCGNQLIH